MVAETLQAFHAQIADTRDLELDGLTRPAAPSSRDADKRRHGSRLGYSVGYSCRGSANALAARIPFQDARTAC
jgi:hypothetical protein